MENKTKNGLIAVGTTLGLLGILYFIFKKKLPNVVNNYSPIPYRPTIFDPYSLVDKATKIKEIKEYLKTNSTPFQKSSYDMGLDPIWTFADSYAKASDDGVNAWYMATKKNEPTFTFYNKIILSNVKIDTKTGLRV